MPITKDIKKKNIETDRRDRDAKQAGSTLTGVAVKNLEEYFSCGGPL